MDFNYFETSQRAIKEYGRMLEPVCRAWSLTRNEVDILLFLRNNPGLDRAADIVSRRGIAKSHVSLSVTTLEEKGLILRREDSSDRRTVHLVLTEQGSAIAAEARSAQKQFFETLHAGITAEELAVWQGIMEKISRNISGFEAQ